MPRKSRRLSGEAGRNKERLYLLHKDHTTPVTASKARQGRLVQGLTWEDALLNFMPVGPRRVFYFPSLPPIRKPIKAFPDPPPGDAL
ncbi:hypothetical protein TNCV_2960171 [Trichonephila clavipes]|nr:hypothetical protein TNCV_2960171 [Trichonephila clavipes]